MTEQSGGGGDGRKKRKEVSSEDVGCSVVVGSSLVFVFLAFLYCYIESCYLCLVVEKREESESNNMRKKERFFSLFG